MTIAELAEGRIQARCTRCLRESPVLAPPAAAALLTLANLGWRDQGEDLTCPICVSRRTRVVRDR